MKLILFIIFSGRYREECEDCGRRERNYSEHMEQQMRAKRKLTSSDKICAVSVSSSFAGFPLSLSQAIQISSLVRLAEHCSVSLKISASMPGHVMQSAREHDLRNFERFRGREYECVFVVEPACSSRSPPDHAGGLWKFRPSLHTVPRTKV